MFLRELSLFGFKSFANRSIFRFERGVTSVVGPNGSGKSNVADAVRWVLGEQSNKLLRAKKSEDVVFFGSDKKQKSSYAEVSLLLDNTDGAIPIEYVEVVVARRLYRSGESEYLINGNKVRLLDVVELMAKAGFAASTYSVIGQGMVDAVLLSSPLERKEFFDEASGIKQYEMKREQSIRKLEQTEENLLRSKDIVAELEPRLNSLRRIAKRAEQKDEIEGELREVQKQYFAGTLHKIIKSLAGRKEGVIGIEKDLRELEKEVEGIDKESKASEELFKEKERILAPHKESILKLKADRDTLKEKLIGREAELRFERELSKRGEEEEKLLRIEDEFNKVIEKLTSAVRGQLEKIFNDLKAMVPVKSSVHENKDLRGLEKDISSIKGKLEAAEKELEAAEIELSSKEREFTVKNDEFFSLQRARMEKEGLLSRLNAKKNELDIETARLETRLEQWREEAAENLGHEAAGRFEAESQPVELSSIEETRARMEKLKRQSIELGAIDDETLNEYNEVEKRHSFLTTQIADLESAGADLKQVITELDELIGKRFRESFQKINEEFGKYFAVLFNGGNAHLKISDEGEGSRGIEIMASPPGKRIQNLTTLSGGERTMTSIALLAAILNVQHTPFVIFDEIDAALDEPNTRRYLKVIDELAKHTQFILITHNKETMKAADIIYGVTMSDDNISKLLSIRLEEAQEVAA